MHSGSSRGSTSAGCTHEATATNAAMRGSLRSTVRPSRATRSPCPRATQTAAASAAQPPRSAACASAMLATVIMRYAFGVGFGWAKDIWVYAFAGCFMLASAGALRISGHVRVDVLFSRMTIQRRAMVDIIATYVFLFPLMVLILNAYAPQLANSWGAASGRLELSSETDGLPLLFLFKTLVPVFAATMLVQGWANALRAAAIIRKQSISAPALALNEEPHA